MPFDTINCSHARHDTKQSLLYNLKLVVHICRVLLVSRVAGLLHVRRHGRIVLLDATLVIAAEGVAAQVRICRVEVCFGLLCCFCVALSRVSLEHGC
jgi:hypothetical protein